MKEGIKKQAFSNWVIRIVGTGFFSWIILRSVDFSEIKRHIGRLNIWMYVILCLIYLLQQFVMSLRWKLLLEKIGLSSSIMGLYRIVLFGQLLNRFLPSSIGGDSAKIYYAISHHPDKKTASVSATLMDRGIGLFSLFFIVMITLPFVSILNLQEKVIGSILMGSVILAIGLLVFGQLDALIVWFMNLRFAQNRIGEYVRRFWDVFLEYRIQKTVLLQAFLYSILTKMIMIIGQYLTFVAVGVDIPLIVIFFVIPLVNLITTIPVSIGGLGLREVSLARILVIPNDQVISYSVVRYSIILLITILLMISILITQLLSRINRNSADAKIVE
jgi:uncharacterized protein (TIRG00374 family)